MSMEVRNPSSGSIHLEMKEFLGEKLYEKYSDIHPLLALCTYRLRTYTGYKTFDLMYNTEETTPRLKIYRRLLHPFVCLKNVFTRSAAGDKVMLSSTVYKSGRYAGLIENIRQNASVVQTNASTDIEVYSKKDSVSGYISKITGKGYGRKILTCSSISGKKLKKAVSDWLDFYLELYKKGLDCTNCTENATRLLDILKKEFDARVEYVAAELKKSGVKQYITINQYNLRDLVLIAACRKTGAKTKQLEHHASRFMHNIATGEDIYRLCFVDEICCWGQSEVDFHQNIYRYESFFTDEAPQIYSVGNPEITFEQAEKANRDYPVQNRITFMVSGLLNTADTESVQKQLNFRNEIFSRLKLLADKTGVKILVRYPPGLDMEFRRKEESLLKDMGFEISPSDRSSLHSDICGSVCIIGTISSVLGVAALLGKPVFQITGTDEKYYITDSNIKSITPDRISRLPVDISSSAPDTSSFMDYGKLLS